MRLVHRDRPPDPKGSLTISAFGDLPPSSRPARREITATMSEDQHWTPMFPECCEHNGAYRAADGFASMCQAFAFLVMHSLMPARGPLPAGSILGCFVPTNITDTATLTTVNDESERKPRRKEPVCDRVGARAAKTAREIPSPFPSAPLFLVVLFPSGQETRFIRGNDAPSVGDDAACGVLRTSVPRSLCSAGSRILGVQINFLLSCKELNICLLKRKSCASSDSSAWLCL